MTNPNASGLGGTLSGLALLLQGLNIFRDPAAEKRSQFMELLQQRPDLRDQYIQQFKDNPEAIDALIGRAPRFGNKSSYESARATLTGPLSQSAQAKAAQEATAKKEAENRLAIANKDASTIATGQAEEAANPYGMVARNVGKGEGGKTNIEIPIGLFQNPEDRARYQELQTGQVLTPTQRKTQKAQLSTEEARLQAAGIDKQTSEVRNALAIEEAKQNESNKVIAQKTIARLGKTGLYNAKREGKLSASELGAVLAYEPTKRQYELSQTEYFMEQQDIIDKSRIAQDKERQKQLKDENAALFLLQRSTDNGLPISMDQARSIAKTGGQAILNSTNPEDEPLKEIVKGIKDASFKKTRAQLTAAYQRWITGLKGRKPTEEQVQDLNNAVEPLFGPMVEPIVFQRVETNEPFYRANKVFVKPISGDENLIKTLPKELQAPAKEAQVKQTSKAVSKDTGNINLPGGSLPPLSPEDSAQAKSNPAFADFLRKKGYKL